MSELSRLMLKAVRSLPPDEQDALLEAMLDPKLAPWPGPGPGLSPAELLPGRVASPHLPSPDSRVEVALPPLGPETGGPWQSVPVRLSTDQHERLKQWCQANGFTMAVVLRGLVARFLDDQATRRPRPASPGPAAAAPGAAPGAGPGAAAGAGPGAAPGAGRAATPDPDAGPPGGGA